MSKYQTPPSWWQLVTLVRELRRVVRQWNGGEITHESAMRAVADLLQGFGHV